MEKNHNKTITFLIGIVLLILIIAFIVVFRETASKKVVVHIGDAVVSATLADNDQKISAEINSSKKLTDNEAVFLKYSNSDIISIDISKIKRSTDLVWVNDQNDIVYIAKNIYPSNTNSSRVITPSRQADGVIELPVGSVDNKAIKIDQQLTIEYNQGLY